MNKIKLVAIKLRIIITNQKLVSYWGLHEMLQAFNL